MKLVQFLLQVDAFVCECPEGWEGEDCSEDVDSCVGEERCFNGGVCVDLVGFLIDTIVIDQERAR